MAEHVQKLHFQRRPGKLYYLDAKGNLVEITPGSKHKQIVARPGIRKEKGYLYYLDKQGHIARAKMKRKKR